MLASQGSSDKGAAVTAIKPNGAFSMLCFSPERQNIATEVVGRFWMAARTTPIVLPVVQLKATDSNGVTPPPNSFPHLSIPKPSWIVRTESNVRREKRKKPDPPCVICNGSGRVDCHHCCGRGRTNLVHLEMLPKGEWPKWCRTCGGSGLGYCSRCLGTGEYRYIMGFQFMMENNETQDLKKYEDEAKQHPRSADSLLNDVELSSEPEI